jgi:transcription-repair coupling factor (superfamily II helicase)
MTNVASFKGKSFFPPMEPVLEALKKGGHPIVVTGLPGSSARAWIIAGLFLASRRPVLVVVPTSPHAEVFHQNLVCWLGWLGGISSDAVYFPELEVLSPEKPLLHPDLLRQRLQILYRLAQGTPLVMVTTEAALTQTVPDGKAMLSGSIRLVKESTLDREDFLSRCVKMGYRRVELVERTGEFGVRGGLVDLFSPALDEPIRMEWSGNRLESIRLFDPETQLSSGEIPEILILPIMEILDTPMIPLTDYFKAKGVLVWDETERPDQRSIPQEMASLRSSVRHAPSEERPDPLPVIFLESLDLDRHPSRDPHAVQIRYPLRTPESLGLGLPGTPLAKALTLLENLRQRSRIMVAAKSATQQQRLLDLFHEHDLPAMRFQEDFPDSQTAPFAIAVGNLSGGFCDDQNRLAVITDEDLFGKAPQQRPLPKPKASRFLTSLEDLKISDYIVHLQHGIGQYQGLRRLTIDGYESDFLVIRYLGGDTLYLPLDRLNLIQKYIGVEGHRPPLDRLGGWTWARTTKRVKKAAEAIARELLDLYAAREVSPGHAFSPDTSLTREFEAAFEFEETPDQLQAIQDVKRDMEQHRPMDRLICGDVGYGKTEVAMRAAFKAVMDNRQVAVLVPTTLLAQQHFQTFRQRFAPFPVRVEMLSRFRSPKEQKAVLSDLAQGKVDILIGTHRLLQKDVVFPNLALLVVDEEQRFGVAHKERLKQLRTTLDVLTLTATPIPRTLQMSLVGIRDLSVIETPPPDRLAIRTILTHFDPQIIRTAILKERARGGQVFFVHNRIEDIERIGGYLKELVPEARIAVAHGRMRERLLESVMLKFVRREYDLLLSTAIIESGLDIPTVNTILIHNAHRFGLSDLYQLRGRVGRSGLQAHAYFLVPSESGLTPEAQKRLVALQEFCELGAGFRIAARDLEIRGAGNLLGRQQSGHVAAVGFEYYLHLVEKAVGELRGKSPEEEIEPVLNLRVSAFIPEDYIPDVYQRLSLYKRLSDLKDEKDLSGLWAELIDRYGSPPQPVQYLWEVIEIKLLARILGIEKLSSVPDGISIAFHPKRGLSDQQIQQLLSAGNGLRFLSEFSLKLPLRDTAWPPTHTALKNCLQTLLQYDRSRPHER